MKKFIGIVFIFAIISCEAQVEDTNKVEIKTDKKMEIATLGAGCFWCIEAIFSELKGVETVESGYMGGEIKNPTYREICSGTTGHAEVAKITYDPAVVKYEEILEIFFKIHDPTTLNRQGADAGTQYRSAIFYHSESQKTKSQYIIQALDEVGAWEDPIVTEVTEASHFYKAEDYHQNYMENNSGQGYCRMVIRPKLEKFREVFKDKLK